MAGSISGGQAWTLGVDIQTAASCVVAAAAVANTNNDLGMVIASYGAAPSTTALLTIAWTKGGVAQLITVPLAVVYAFSYDFTGLVHGDLNTAITVTLPTGGAGVIGYLNAMYATH